MSGHQSDSCHDYNVVMSGIPLHDWDGKEEWFINRHWRIVLICWRCREHATVVHPIQPCTVQNMQRYPFCLSESSMCFSCVCVQCIYIFCKKRDVYMTRKSEGSKAFTFYTTSPINWGYALLRDIFCKRLAAMLSEKRDSHTTKWQGGYIATYVLPC